ncbi:hypothetical protein BN2537_6209 [Streptomyces venezuelae]|nr:hypothetical protein BN2537_6209 [Streptomyces venezuelae]
MDAVRGERWGSYRAGTLAAGSGRSQPARWHGTTAVARASYR